MKNCIAVFVLFVISCSTSLPRFKTVSLADMGFTNSPVYYDQIAWRAKELGYGQCPDSVTNSFTDNTGNLFVFMEPRTMPHKDFQRVYVIRYQDGKRFIGTSYVSDGWNKDTVWVFTVR